MQQIIQLKPNEDIAAVRAHIQAAELSHVILVVPRGSVALASQRGLQLLRRAAEDAGVEVGLVIHDYEIRDRAVEFGFPIFNSITQAQRTRWRMQPLVYDLVQGAPMPSSMPGPAGGEAHRPDIFRQWGGVVATGIAVSFALCLLAIVFVPTANVRIVPASVALSTDFQALADPSITQINSETRSIPARRLTQEISGTLTVKTTTEKSIPNAPSTGTVIFSNLRAEEATVPQGTIVKTSAGVPIRFSTVTTETIPAGINNRVEVTVQAVEPGPSGNVKELAINTIEGSLAIVARVINLKPTASGSLRPVKVVTADDKKKLTDQLLQQLRQQGNSLLQRSLKPGEFMPYESVLLDVSDETFDHAVDDPADTLTLRMSAVVFGLAIDGEDSEGLVRTLLERQMPAGYQLLPGGVRVVPQPGGKYQGIALRLPIRGVGYATPQIDSAKVARALQGKTFEEAEAFIMSQINLARPLELNISPVGWNRMPYLAFRIAVFVEPQAVSHQ